RGRGGTPRQAHGPSRLRECHRRDGEGGRGGLPRLVPRGCRRGRRLGGHRRIRRRHRRPGIAWPPLRRLSLRTSGLRRRIDRWGRIATGLRGRITGWTGRWIDLRRTSRVAWRGAARIAWWRRSRIALRWLAGIARRGSGIALRWLAGIARR